MIAGKLKHKMDVFKPTLTTNEYGEQIEQYELVCSTHCEIINMGGGLTTQNSENFYSYSKQFKVRHYVPIDEFFRVQIDNDKMYNVKSVEVNEDWREKIIDGEQVNG